MPSCALPLLVLAAQNSLYGADKAPSQVSTRPVGLAVLHPTAVHGYVLHNENFSYGEKAWAPKKSAVPRLSHYQYSALSAAAHPSLTEIR